MFRISTDRGATFGDKINLSNTATADAIDAEISAGGGNVVVTWGGNEIKQVIHQL